MAKLSRRERRALKHRLENVKQPEEGKEEKKHEVVHEAVVEKKPFVQRFFDKNYKKLILIPILLLLLSIIIIAVKYSTTGEIVDRDVSLKGGITLTIQTEKPINIDELQDMLKEKFADDDIGVRVLSKTGKQIGFLVNAGIDIKDKPKIDSLLNEIKTITDIELTEENYSIEFIGSSLGASFFRETITAVLIAFLFMGIVVFIAFRKLVPSLFVILAAVSDIICTLAFINIIGVKLSTAGIAAFLMLIGYSVDTDIMLTTRVLKREKGTLSDRIMNAMKTGLAMSLTSFIAVTIAYFFTPSEVLKQIMLILAIGLVFDIINTWLENAGILRYWIEHKAKKQTS